ncbi:MAG: hypothetical protein AVDCRST_MAG30-1941 [uncultured Solirubrobacteraceae bacterium]|uniref:Uncharacterized protein n=1 Tax=uncultured Solirubrobacteraceae bacterium TaxID=1162706 RepID=A0A6J4SK96_9ACTN|nr:MAG: hypothetical protein AVDCRST_MAG30-1941 [uncultured Solirubrobacteraceae bacterium]
MRLFAMTLLCLAALVVAVAPAGAIVPPRDCGNTTVKGKRYNIKADQLSCSTAKPHARRYLSTGRRPSGYRCRNYSAGSTKLKFKCDRGVRSFFAIRR